ncbi:MAG: hypothetical protein GC190_02635 [Alphaproteobacteria bacterium]|nr:hypothetical protein [Alphaproteobacteria bacterium]
MRRLTIVGLILIVGGIVALAVPYITYSQEKHVMNVGPIQVQATEEKRLPIPQIAAVAAILAGLVLVFLDQRAGR